MFQKVSLRLGIWLLVGLLAVNAAQMVFTAWLYAESFKLQAEAKELAVARLKSKDSRSSQFCLKNLFCPKTSLRSRQSSSLASKLRPYRLRQSRSHGTPTCHPIRKWNMAAVKASDP